MLNLVKYWLRFIYFKVKRYAHKNIQQ